MKIVDEIFHVFNTLLITDQLYDELYNVNYKLYGYIMGENDDLKHDIKKLTRIIKI